MIFKGVKICVSKCANTREKQQFEMYKLFETIFLNIDQSRRNYDGLY